MAKWIKSIALVFLLFFLGTKLSGANTNQLAPINISANGKYLVKSNGDPFLWIGDTAWDLHHRLTREEITEYLENRKAKGFSIILFKIPLNELSSAGDGNRYGHFPFQNKDIAKPNDDFFQLVDYSLDEMERLDLVAGFLPLWGFVVANKYGYYVTDEDVAYYANWVGTRYTDRKNIVWISGGDTGGSSKWATLGRGLKATDPQKLVTFHPGRQRISSYHLFGEADWLDFHMTQTGHTEDLASNYLTITEVYNNSSKPIINGEPAYEDIRSGEIRISPHQVRKAAYWSLFAGGFGHQYGHVEIFQFARAVDGQIDTYGANNYWKESLDAPGAFQIGTLKSLLNSIPWHTYQPNQGLIASSNPIGPKHMRATIAANKSAALIYFPENKTAIINRSPLIGKVTARWFDPKTGTFQSAGPVPSTGNWEVTPPITPDALLVLETGDPGPISTMTRTPRPTETSTPDPKITATQTATSSSPPITGVNLIRNGDFNDRLSYWQKIPTHTWLSIRITNTNYYLVAWPWNNYIAYQAGLVLTAGNTYRTCLNMFSDTANLYQINVRITDGSNVIGLNQRLVTGAQCYDFVSSRSTQNGRFELLFSGLKRGGTQINFDDISLQITGNSTPSATPTKVGSPTMTPTIINTPNPTKTSTPGPTTTATLQPTQTATSSSPPVGDNLIQNGDFNNRLNYWQKIPTHTWLGTRRIGDNKYLAAWPWNGYVAYQAGLALNAGRSYRTCLRMFTNTENPYVVNVRITDGSSVIGLDQRLMTGEQCYDFVASKSTQNGRFEFFFSGLKIGGTQVNFDDISLKEH